MICLKKSSFKTICSQPFIDDLQTELYREEAFCHLARDTSESLLRGFMQVSRSTSGVTHRTSNDKLSKQVVDRSSRDDKLSISRTGGTEMLAFDCNITTTITVMEDRGNALSF